MTAAPFTLTDPVSLDDIAKRLEVASQTPHQWRRRGILPPPLFVVSHVPVWDWPVIFEWARSTGRLPVDRPAEVPAEAVSDKDAAHLLLSGRW